MILQAPKIITSADISSFCKSNISTILPVKFINFDIIVLSLNTNNPLELTRYQFNNNNIDDKVYNCTDYKLVIYVYHILHKYTFPIWRNLKT